MTFSKWQESDVRENGKNIREKQESDVRKSHIDECPKNSWIWQVSNKTTALSSLRTAQADRSETRQNEKRYYKIQKGFYLSVDKYSDQSLMWIL